MDGHDQVRVKLPLNPRLGRRQLPTVDRIMTLRFVRRHHWLMQHFVDDDPSYLAWLAEHPAGYVINTNRRPSATNLVLHQATCRTISGPTRGSTFTGDYTKASGNRAELDSFARDLGGKAQPCQICLGQSGRSQNRRPGSKYADLRDFLAALDGNEVAMTFADVEELVGALPESARRHRPWWGNDSRGQALAWQNAGWRVDKVDLAAEQVVFVRDASARPMLTAGATANRQLPYVDAEVGAALIARARELGFDTTKLARLIDELNENYRRSNTYAAHALLRAILDHIPPILRCSDFQAILSNHQWSRRTGRTCAGSRTSGRWPTTRCTGRSPARQTCST